MGSLAELARDQIKITKPDGTEFGPYRAVVSQKRIICFERSADFDPGDKVTRVLPSGKEDVYYVVDATFHDGTGLDTEDLSNWEVRTSRSAPGDLPSAPKQSASINIHGAHNVQVGDGNQQTVSITLGEVLRKVDEAMVPEEQKEEAKSALRKAFEHPLLLAAVGPAFTALFGG